MRKRASPGVSAASWGAWRLDFCLCYPCGSVEMRESGRSIGVKLRDGVRVRGERIGVEYGLPDKTDN